MTFWILYITLNGKVEIKHPYHFAFKETCDTVGESLIKDYKYREYRCTKKVIK